MIMYNTLMGVAAGLALILVPVLVRKLYRRQPIAPEGWSLTFGILGFMLALLGGLMATTWPLVVNLPLNIMFGEPCLFLGLLLVAASIFLWQRRDVINTISSANKKEADIAYTQLRRNLVPVSWVVFGLGLMLVASTLAILRFGIVGSAPAAEPISGLLADYPVIENTFFGILYGLAAIGTILAPYALMNFGGKAARIAGVCMVTSGVIFLCFSAMNYYTHSGMLHNMNKGTHYRW
jgi:uncharacterized membrane protein